MVRFDVFRYCDAEPKTFALPAAPTPLGSRPVGRAARMAPAVPTAAAPCEYWFAYSGLYAGLQVNKEYFSTFLHNWKASGNAPCVLVLRIQLRVDSTVEVAHFNALLEDVHRHLEMIALRLLASPHHLQYSGGALQVASVVQAKKRWISKGQV